jgi:HK97 family phage major capsid protein
MTTETEQTVGDRADLVVELKALEKTVVEKFDELAETGAQLDGEVKTLGEAKAETLAKFEAIATQYDEVCDRVQNLEQKGVTSFDDAPQSAGEMFAADESVRNFCEGKQNSARMEIKTAIINATGQNQPLVQSDRSGGIWATPNRVLRIRDLLMATPTSSNLIEFTRENSFSNAAAPTVAGSPEKYENVTKPESAITFTLVNEPVVTLAHFIPASKQVMADSADLASHVNNRLIYGLRLKEETQFLSGTGANHQLNGLITQATAYTPTSPQMTNEIDIIRHAMLQANVAEYTPNMLVLNPADWYDIATRKVSGSDDRYVIGNPNELRPSNLWGLPVVVTNSISAGTFLLGSSMAAEIRDREMVNVAMSEEDSDNFRKNMITVRAESRVALVVYRTEAFITGSL